MKSSRLKSSLAMMGAMLLQTAASYGVITITPNTPPPTASATDGSTLVITSGATSNTAGAALTYQWFKAGLLKTGATAAKLTLPAIKDTDAGDYYLRVTSTKTATDPTVFSSTVTVTVNVRPKITVQPTVPTTAIAEGGTHKFLVTLDPKTTLTGLDFIWQKKVGTVWTDLTDQVAVPPNPVLTDSYEITNAVLANAGSYRVKATNNTGTVVISKELLLKVSSRPVILTQPGVNGAFFVATGGTGVLKVVVGGDAPFTYKWFKNNVQVATTATLTVKGDEVNSPGTYKVEVTNSKTPVNMPTVSDPVVVSVIKKPTIPAAGQPVKATVLIPPGGDHTFTVAPDQINVGTLKFQWYKDAKILVGATNASLLISPVTWLNRGSYKCVVSNEVGTITSASVVLTVNSMPIIITQPVSFVGATGGIASFTVVAGGDAPLKYQWSFKAAGAMAFVDLVTGKAAKLSLTKLKALPDITSQAGTYKCKVSNPRGDVETVEVTLGVDDPPKITGSPMTAKVAVTANLQASITATGAPTLLYQWQKNGVNLNTITYPSAATPNLNIPTTAITDSGTYRCVVKNAVGTATSLGAVISVQTVPQVLTVGTPAATIIEDDLVQVPLTASGSATLKYEWQKEQETQPGMFSWQPTVPAKIGATLSFTKIAIAEAGKYRCRVYNDVGTAFSTDVVLAVSPIPVPTLNGMYPTRALKGEKVRILGTDLNYVTSVKLGAAVASYVIESKTSLLVTIPANTPVGALPISVSSKNPNSPAQTPGNFTLTPSYVNEVSNDRTIIIGSSGVVSGDSTAFSQVTLPVNIAWGFPAAFYEWTVPTRSNLFVTVTGSTKFDCGLTVIVLDDNGVAVPGQSKTVDVALKNVEQVDSIKTTTANQRVIIYVTSKWLSTAYENQGPFKIKLSTTPNTTSTTVSSFEASEGFKKGGSIAGSQDWESSGSADTASVVETSDGSQAVKFGGAGATGGEPVFLWKNVGGSSLEGSSIATQFDMSLEAGAADGDDNFAWQVSDQDGAPMMALWVNSDTGAIQVVEADGTAHESIQHVVFGASHKFEVIVNSADHTWTGLIDGAPITDPIALPAAAQFGDVSAVWDLGKDGQASGASIIFDNFSVTAK